jgi:hypothetical protein
LDIRELVEVLQLCTGVSLGLEMMVWLTMQYEANMFSRVASCIVCLQGTRTMQIRDKLYDTREILFHCSSHSSEDILAVLNRLGGLVDTRELMEVLQLFHRSLIETGDDGVANGAVLDAIRQVQTFGSSLVRLDIRQESTRHREVMSAITEFLGLGSFEKWSEEERTAFLLKELQVLSFARSVKGCRNVRMCQSCSTAHLCHSSGCHALRHLLFSLQCM